MEAAQKKKGTIILVECCKSKNVIYLLQTMYSPTMLTLRAEYLLNLLLRDGHVHLYCDSSYHFQLTLHTQHLTQLSAQHFRVNIG